MKLKAFSVVSDVSHPGAERLRRSAAFWGWDHTFILQKDGWRPTYKAEQIGQLEALQRFSPEFCIYVDGWDTVFTGPPQELPLEKGKLTFGGDTVLFPESGFPEDNFPKVGLEEFRYVNAGTIWGDTAVLQELCDEYLNYYPNLVNQAYFNYRFCFEHFCGGSRLAIDTKAEVSLNVMLMQLRHFQFRQNRVRYLPTGSMPLVLHSAGVGPSLSEVGKLAPLPPELEKLYAP